MEAEVPLMSPYSSIACTTPTAQLRFPTSALKQVFRLVKRLPKDQAGLVRHN